MRYAAVIVIALAEAGGAGADGGAVRCSERMGAIRVTVFTSPTPLRAGPVDVSVLVQDAATLRPVADAAVTVRLRPAGRPGVVVHQAATAAQATNKLLYAALVDLPDPGPWDAAVQVESSSGSGKLSFAVDVADRTPRWWDLVWWIAWPAVPVLLFLLHLVLQTCTRRSRNLAATCSSTATALQ